MVEHLSGVVLLLLLTDSSSGHSVIEHTLHMVRVVVLVETLKGVETDAKVL